MPPEGLHLPPDIAQRFHQAQAEQIGIANLYLRLVTVAFEAAQDRWGNVVPEDLAKVSILRANALMKELGLPIPQFGVQPENPIA